jgi:hypothetical protein
LVDAWSLSSAASRELEQDVAGHATAEEVSRVDEHCAVDDHWTG